MRAYVYVDGFNLYYGALKGTAYKWLNPVALARQLVPAKYAIDRLKYFTARVSGANDPGAPVKQKAYLDALGTVPEIEVHFGRFLSKTSGARSRIFPSPARRFIRPHRCRCPTAFMSSTEAL